MFVITCIVTSMARNSLLCADVPLRNYSLTHSLGLSVCLSVGMLHGGIASKRLNIPDKCSSFQFILSRIDVRESKAKYRRAASLFFQLNVLD